MQLFKKKDIHINFRQPKYIFPAFLYLPLLLVGYAVTSMFAEPEETKAAQRNDYIQSDLPEANISADLGDKESNIEDQYGIISDSTAMSNVENDNDSVNKKLDYQSRYSGRELELLQQQQNDQKELQQLRAMQSRVHRNTSNGGGGFSSPISESDIKRVQRKRRQNAFGQLEDDLYGDDSDNPMKPFYNPNGFDANGNPLRNGSRKGNGVSQGNTDESIPSSVQEVKEKPLAVTKAKASSDYFNTIRPGKTQSSLITAIIDENIKAVEGSRIRLRLLDDIDIEGLIVKKGTYIYAIMGGFGSQRVHGTIQSILVGDEIVHISLSMYDTDGLEGLYIPESSFRETSKELLESATDNPGSLTNSYGSSQNALKTWGNQVVQNVSQKVMNSLQRRVRKNRVLLKYGTRVYLINSSPESGNNSRPRRGTQQTNDTSNR